MTCTYPLSLGSTFVHFSQRERWRPPNWTQAQPLWMHRRWPTLHPPVQQAVLAPHRKHLLQKTFQMKAHVAWRGRLSSLRTRIFLLLCALPAKTKPPTLTVLASICWLFFLYIKKCRSHHCPSWADGRERMALREKSFCSASCNNFDAGPSVRTPFMQFLRVVTFDFLFNCFYHGFLFISLFFCVSPGLCR